METLTGLAPLLDKLCLAQTQNSKACIPLAMRGRLPTMDRIVAHDGNSSKHCWLCSAGLESNLTSTFSLSALLPVGLSKAF